MLRSKDAGTEDSYCLEHNTVLLLMQLAQYFLLHILLESVYFNLEVTLNIFEVSWREKWVNISLG